jgi:hypothetical protein
MLSSGLEYNPQKGIAFPCSATKDYCLCLLRSFMEAGAEGKGMKRETFDASKM